MTDGPDGSAGAGAAAVVVNYESGDELAACVAGLQREHPAEIVVVDNGSEDGSVQRCRERFPGVVVLAPGRNLGYGAAANRGVAATGSELVMVCNPDLVVSPGAIRVLADALGGDPRAGLVGPLLRSVSGDRYPSARRFPSLVDAAGHALIGIFDPDNRFTRAYHQAELAGDTRTTRTVDWVSGACIVVRRTAFEDVGGFDESYFMYLEDVDLCWRLGRAGWATAYVPRAEAVHLQGTSTARHPYRMVVEHHRSLLRFAVSSTQGWRRSLLPLVAAGIGTRAVLAVLRQWRVGGLDRSPSAGFPAHTL